MSEQYEVFVVIIQNRHAEVDVRVASSCGQADIVARSFAPYDAEPTELTDAMKADGWILYLPYGSEGDSVRIVKRILNS